jgi:hypothetical protein
MPRALLSAMATLTAAMMASCGGTVAPVGPGDDGGLSDAHSTDGGANEGGGNGASCLGNSGVCEQTGSFCHGVDAGQASCATGFFCCQGEGVPEDGGGPSPACPSSPPGSGPCPKVGIECEYGNNANADCNDVYSCGPTGWTTGEVACPVPTCPSSYASVPINSTCSPTGGICGYEQGTCTCSEGSPPRINGPVWQCFPAQTGCPSPRPDLGTPCSAPSSLTCDYGACSGGISLSCQDGSWQQSNTACPG